MATIGFIGLGNMGMPMATRLQQAGHDVQCFDTNPAALEKAAKVGIKPCASIASAVSGVQYVISMLPSGKDVLAALVAGTGDEPVKYAKSSVVIDCSTIDMTSCVTFHQSLSEREIATLDAPVSGGVEGAAAGTLTFMVGGNESTFVQALPILQAMGKKIVHAGGAGAGQAAKICNNMIAGISMIAVSESLTLAKRLGLDPRKFFEIASTSSGQCWALTSYSPLPDLVPTSPANRGYEGGFASSLMLKDLRLAEQAAIASGSPALLGAAAASLYAIHCKAGNGRLDFSSIVQMLSEPASSQAS